jgi:hypothetical protein
MKTPAVAIAASFVGGIVLGLGTGFAHRSTSPIFLVECSVIAGLSILAGLTVLPTPLVFVQRSETKGDLLQNGSMR